jgi:hypothetical protein
MFDNAEIMSGQELRRRPDVAAVGAWLTRAKQVRQELADYVPRHRAAGPAV